MIESSYPHQTRTLESSFHQPSSVEYDSNPLYWDAYKAEQALVTQHCPSAAGIPEWGMYRDVVLGSLPPADPWDSAAVGRNACVNDVSVWEWEENPTSGNNMVYEQAGRRNKP
jgi:hypothetical protein